ncbi:hypothetical protein L4D20_14200 [Vibrio kyushuensis]|uniref:hypothetical protein n=1 Tax=Vibrio TaxID=662 RepID=UPI003D0C5A71
MTLRFIFINLLSLLISNSAIADQLKEVRISEALQMRPSVSFGYGNEGNGARATLDLNTTMDMQILLQYELQRDFNVHNIRSAARHKRLSKGIIVDYVQDDSADSSLNGSVSLFDVYSIDNQTLLVPSLGFGATSEEWADNYAYFSKIQFRYFRKLPMNSWVTVSPTAILGLNQLKSNFEHESVSEVSIDGTLGYRLDDRQSIFIDANFTDHKELISSINYEINF